MRLLALALAACALCGAATAADSATHPGHSEDDIMEARKEFLSIDTNGDGFITREEILEMEEVPEREEMDEFFNTYDTDGDGRVTFDEILKADGKLLDETDKEL